MIRTILLLAVCISVFAKEGEMKVSPDAKEPKKDEIVCCEINKVGSQNAIRFNKVCIGKGKTVIVMEYTKAYSACTLLESNILMDDRGKKYLPTFHSGLPNCPTRTNANIGHKFFWGFESIDTTAKILKLKEDEKKIPQNMIPVKWTEIDISHCKW